MNITELKEKSQHSREGSEEVWFTPPFRSISVYITKQLIKTKITANQVTLMGALTGILGGICFSFGSGIPSIIGSLFLLFALLLDCVDGEVARYKKTCSLTGLTFDMFAQSVVFVSALFGISVGCVKELDNFYSILGFLTTTIYLLSANLSSLKYSVAVEARNLCGTSTIKEKRGIENAVSNTRRLLDFGQAVVREFLKTPNQMLIFLFVSILDAIKIPGPIVLEYRITYLASYIGFLFVAITCVFVFKVLTIARTMETDKLCERLK